jgi:DNA-binding transcriptional ArsR family regulator
MAEQLAAGEKCVCELGEGVDADFSTISKHLTILKQAGVVVDEKRGKQVYYSLRNLQPPRPRNSASTMNWRRFPTSTRSCLSG